MLSERWIFTQGVAPCSEVYDAIYGEVIQPAAMELGFAAIRVDEVEGPGTMLEDIQQEIRRARAVDAEISNHRPNAFYELNRAT
jgi:hypothetical protein